MDTIRVFIAIDVKVESKLEAKWNELRNLLRNNRIKWVDKDSLHLTLFFLGETPANLIEDISKKLETELKSTATFSIKLQGFGTFGQTHSPKVIWADIIKSEPLNALKLVVSKVITQFGFADQHGSFSPHFTLGRIKHIESKNELARFINLNKTMDLQTNEVNKIVIYQSILKPSGPVYKPLKSITLPSL